jgi:tRNA1(Val) A37 N6-methylase TrmN6
MITGIIIFEMSTDSHTVQNVLDIGTGRGTWAM